MRRFNSLIPICADRNFLRQLPIGINRYVQPVSGASVLNQDYFCSLIRQLFYFWTQHPRSRIQQPNNRFTLHSSIIPFFNFQPSQIQFLQTCFPPYLLPTNWIQDTASMISPLIFFLILSRCHNHTLSMRIFIHIQIKEQRARSWLFLRTYVRTYMVYRCRVVRLINRPLVDSSRCFIKIGGTNSKRASNTSLFRS